MDWTRLERSASGIGPNEVEYGGVERSRVNSYLYKGFVSFGYLNHGQVFY